MMNRARTRLSVFLTAYIFIHSSLTYGWGALGHQVVAHVASTLNTKDRLWSVNADNMVMLTVVPDKYWKFGGSRNAERTNHWFQPDTYYSNPSDFSLIPEFYSKVVAQFGQEEALVAGTTPWRILQLYSLCVEALSDGDFVTAIQTAGVMSHYVGDLSQPLHVTKNYDGQETDQKGIHGFFETANLKKIPFDVLAETVTTKTRALLKDPNFLSQNNGSILDMIFNETFRAYRFKDLVLEIDSQFGRRGVGAEKQRTLAIERIADGTATLTLILARAWKEAHTSHAIPGSIKTPVPKWIPNDFSATRSLEEAQTPNLFAETDLDCLE